MLFPVVQPASPYQMSIKFVPYQMTPYQSIRLKILEDQKRGSSYDKAFVRGNTVIDLVNQIEKDFFEIKSNQYALQQFLLSTQLPYKQNTYKQNISAFTPMPTR
jgi:hypothetical protein